MRGRETCRYHGGKNARGIGAARYGKTKLPSTLPGTYSKFIPVKLAADYRKAQSDPERLAMAHEIRVWSAREQELLRRVDPGDPGSAWRQLRDAKAALDAAQVTGDVAAMRSAYTKLGEAIERASADYGLWDKVKEAHTFLMQLRAQEHKRLTELQSSWNADQVSARWGQFLHALWECANEMLPKELIRPFLVRFQDKIRMIDVEFTDVTPRTKE